MLIIPQCMAKYVVGHQVSEVVVTVTVRSGARYVSIAEVPTNYARTARQPRLIQTTTCLLYFSLYV